MRNGATECGWRHAPEAREGFGGFWKRQLSWVLPREKTVDFRLLAEALGRCRTRWRVGGDEKARIERMCISPYVEEPLNSKVIKSFVPELRSRECFSCFEIHMFYVYMIWTVYLRFTHVRIMAMISNSPRLLSRPMRTVPNAPITIGITVTFVFHSFFSSPARSRYLSIICFLLFLFLFFVFVFHFLVKLELQNLRLQVIFYMS